MQKNMDEIRVFEGGGGAFSQSTLPVLLLQFDNHMCNSKTISWLPVTRLFQIADWVDLWFCDRRYSYWIQDARTRLAVNLLHA
jgi:hypothetical protein